MKIKSDSYIVVINNPSESDEEIENKVKKLNSLKYYVFQRERGNNPEDEYIIMFLKFKTLRSSLTLKKYFSNI